MAFEWRHAKVQKSFATNYLKNYQPFYKGHVRHKINIGKLFTPCGCWVQAKFLCSLWKLKTILLSQVHKELQWQHCSWTHWNISFAKQDALPQIWLLPKVPNAKPFVRPLNKPPTHMYATCSKSIIVSFEFISGLSYCCFTALAMETRLRRCFIHWLWMSPFQNSAFVKFYLKSFKLIFLPVADQFQISCVC